MQISAVPTKILDFFHEFDRVTVSQYRPQHFWVFDRAEVDFCDYWVSHDGVQFLEAMWKKYGNYIDSSLLESWSLRWRSYVDSSLLCVGTNEEHQP